MLSRCFALGALLTAFWFHAFPLPASSAPRTWIGGDGNWVDDTANDTNWNPASEPDFLDEAIFNANDNVQLIGSNTVEALTMSGSARLSINDNSFTINGPVQLSGSGTRLVIEDEDAMVAADSVSIGSESAVNLIGGQLVVDEESGDGLLAIDAGGTLQGHGTVRVTDDVAIGTVLISNDGTIAAMQAPSSSGPPAGTLAFVAADDVDAYFDLDGPTENGVVNVGRNQTLDIDITLADTFVGDINLFHNSVLDIEDGWILGVGTIDVDTGATPDIPPVPAGTATIRGGTLGVIDGTITVEDTDGTLEFDTTFNMLSGDFINNGHVIFNRNATIGSVDANFVMATDTSRLTVGASRTVTVLTADFDLDGPGTDNVIAIESGGLLDVDLGVGGDESIGGMLVLNGGTLDISTSDEEWSIVGRVEVGAGPDATLRASDIGGILLFEASSEVALNGNLQLDNRIARVEPGATFTGDGTLINIPGSTFSPLHQANINTQFENRGTYANSGLDAGRNDFLGFRQTDAGAFRVTLLGTANADYDRIAVAGATELGGDLNIELKNEFVPASGDVFTIISAGGAITGTFDAVNALDDLPAGLQYQVFYGTSLVQLLVLLPGDYNRDNAVDAADFAVWRHTQGQSVDNFTGADGNGDGMIDSADYDLWTANFGVTVGSGSSSILRQLPIVVPEPATLATLLAAVMATSFFRRKDGNTIAQSEALGKDPEYVSAALKGRDR